MRYVDEYRDPPAAEKYAKALRKLVTRPWRIMEVCGGQTHSIVRFGIDRLLPEGVELIHGPGCPVCVTSLETIDQAIRIAELPGVILCTFADMLPVPGGATTLAGARARGARVRAVTSPFDALQAARENPEDQVVFFGVGFETTAPVNALAVQQAEREGLRNFSLLASHVLVPPALHTILSAPTCRIQGFLAAGHVCTIMGTAQYEPIARRYRVPIVVTGFEPLDLLQGIYMCLQQLEAGRHAVENQYARYVRPAGNVHARAAIEAVFEITDRDWRGVGAIADSGLAIRERYADFDADRRFPDTHAKAKARDATGEESECIAGLVLQGEKRPADCPAFATRCTPEAPLGAPMVSSEGACAAYYRYRNQSRPQAQAVGGTAL